jgi:hypothetical protein
MASIFYLEMMIKALDLHGGIKDIELDRTTDIKHIDGVWLITKELAGI